LVSTGALANGVSGTNGDDTIIVGEKFMLVSGVWTDKGLASDVNGSVSAFTIGDIHGLDGNDTIEIVNDHDGTFVVSSTVQLRKPSSNVGSIFGDDGNDTIHGSEGPDHIEGGAGDDVIYGFGGSDTIIGGPGDDTLNGGDDDDIIIGGELGSILECGSWACLDYEAECNPLRDYACDACRGGGGNDQIVCADIIDGQSGTDDQCVTAVLGTTTNCEGSTIYNCCSPP
jgi:Ca2+-binding RTX toxin-like protein